MPPVNARSPRRGGRARGGPALGPIEALERREVLSYSALGYSLPDLTVRAFSAPIAAYGGTISVTVDVFNRGASSFVEPLNLTQGAGSTADAPPSVVSVYASPRPGLKGAVLIGTINVPAVRQNDVDVISADLTLPNRPAGFPANGGRIYLTYVVNANAAILESDYTNNTFVSNQPVVIRQALPNIQVIGFETPSPLQPGDTIRPSIRLQNIGTAPTNVQGPLIVQLVASQDQNYGPGDAILATYIVDNVPPSAATTGGINVGNGNVTAGANIVTLNTQFITLPPSPRTYYLGVKVNPLSTIAELGNHTSPRFDAVVPVGPPIAGLPPSVLLPPTDANGNVIPGNQFPFKLGPSNAGITVGGATAADATTGGAGLVAPRVSPFLATFGTRRPTGPASFRPTGPSQGAGPLLLTGSSPADAPAEGQTPFTDPGTIDGRAPVTGLTNG